MGKKTGKIPVKEPLMAKAMDRVPIKAVGDKWGQSLNEKTIIKNTTEPHKKTPEEIEAEKEELRQYKAEIDAWSPEDDDERERKAKILEDLKDASENISPTSRISRADMMQVFERVMKKSVLLDSKGEEVTPSSMQMGVPYEIRPQTYDKSIGWIMYKSPVAGVGRIYNEYIDKYEAMANDPDRVYETEETEFETPYPYDGDFDGDTVPDYDDEY